MFATESSIQWFECFLGIAIIVVRDGVGPPPPNKNVTIDTLGTH